MKLLFVMIEAFTGPGLLDESFLGSYLKKAYLLDLFKN
jgi:hypothetical protein